jgi:hypothetical protein
MVWPWWAFIVLTVATVALWWIDGGIDGNAWLFAAGMVVAVGALSLGIFGLIISVGRHYNRVECRTFAQTTNRETRFVLYSTFRWDCLTPDGNGKWIPTKNLREFGSDS